MRLVRRLLFVYALGELLLGSAAGLLVRASAPSGGAPTAGRNAAWIAHHWVGSPHSRAEVAMLCALLREHRIGTVYIHVGPADAAGRIAAGRAPYAAQFASTLHGVCPGIRALAWIGQLGRAVGSAAWFRTQRAGRDGGSLRGLGFRWRAVQSGTGPG